MKCRPFVFAAVIAAVMFAVSGARGQASPTARRGGHMTAGFAYSNANSDYVTKRIGGFSAFGTFDLTPYFGLEADAHVLDFFTPQDFAEQSYMAGGRFFYRKQRYAPYVKFLGGLGRTIQQPVFNVPAYADSYGLFAGGAGLDIRAGKRWEIRAVDFEYQVWPAYAAHDLSPSILSFGIAYRIR